MDTLKKVLKSKTLKEAITNLPYSFFDICAFIMITWFAIQPFLREALEMMSFHYYLLIKWRQYNFYVLGFGGLLLLLYYFKRRIDGSNGAISFLKKNKAILLFLVFALLMAISTIINGIDKMSLIGSQYRREGFLGYCSYIVYFLLAYIISDKRLKNAWIFIFTGTAVFIQIEQLVDFCTIDYFYSNHWSYIYYIFDQYNHLGYYIMMAMALEAMMFVCSEKKWIRILFLAEFAFSALSLLINNTFGCQIAIVAGIIFSCIVYSLTKGKFKPITLVPLAVFALVGTGAYFASDKLADNIKLNCFQIVNDAGALGGDMDEAERTTGVARIILWENTWSYVLEKPVFGFSADATGDRLEKDTKDNDRCHCEYLNYAVSFGIPAAAVYIAAVLAIYLRGLKFRKKLSDMNIIGLCCAFAYLVSAGVGNSMFYTTPLLFIMLGFGYFSSKQIASDG